MILSCTPNHEKVKIKKELEKRCSCNVDNLYEKLEIDAIIKKTRKYETNLEPVSVNTGLVNNNRVFYIYCTLKLNSNVSNELIYGSLAYYCYGENKEAVRFPSQKEVSNIEELYYFK